MPNEDGLHDPAVIVANRLWNDPRTRPLMEEGLATLEPERASIAVPNLMLRREIAEDRAKLQKDREEFAAERKKDKDAADSAALSQAWRRGAINAGAQPHELAAIEEIANKALIGDPEAAVLKYRKQQELAAPTPGRFGVQMPGVKAGAFFKGLDENPDAWARERAHTDLAAIRAGRPLEPSPLG